MVDTTAEGERVNRERVLVWTSVAMVALTLITTIFDLWSHALEHPDGAGKLPRNELDYVWPILAIVSTLLLAYWIYQQSRKLAKVTHESDFAKAALATAQRDGLCAFGGNCMIQVGSHLWPKGECDGLENEVTAFLQLLKSKKAQEKSRQEYIARASVLRADESESWHVLYATLDAVVEYYGEMYRPWIFGENDASRDRRKRILIVKDAPDVVGDYGAVLNEILHKLARSSRLRVITDKSLVANGHSSILRDFGVFKNKENGRLEALLSFSLCNLADVFSQARARHFTTNDQAYAQKLVDTFESVWSAENLKADFEEARLRFLEPKDASAKEPVQAEPVWRWKSCAEQPLSRAALRDLFDNRIPAIRISQFATPAECSKMLAQVNAVRLDRYSGVYPPIDKIGVTQFEAGAGGKKQYFDEAEQATGTLRRIFDASFDPITRIRDILSKAFSGQVDIAGEADGKSYFAGLFRQMKEGTLLHVDFAQRDAPDWCIADIDAQIAWNLFLSDGGGGGECDIYNQQWQSCHETRKKEKTYGYEEAVVRGVEHLAVKPVVGDVLLFNCRNFHRVLPTPHARITLGSFVGRMSDRLVLWS